VASNVATLQAKLIADTSQFLSALKRAQGGLTGVGRGFKAMSMAAAPLKMIGGMVTKLAGGLVRIGQIAAGIILAEVFRKAAQAVQWFMRTALSATEIMQRLGIQIQTLAARELSKSIDATINQAVNWRKAGKESDTLVFNVEMLREAVKKYGDVILDVNPELKNIINSNKKFATVAVDVAKKWMSTSDVFDQSAGTATKFINQLKRIAIISPFTVATTNTMFRLASALGFTQKQSVTVTKGMLDVAAGLGLTEEAAQRLILNFSQIRSQGKLTQRDIREMSLTGFQMADVFDEMNRTLGTNIKTNLDFNKALKSSQFTWEEFVNAFASMSEREFGESAKRMAFTIGGLKSTFADVFLTTIPAILIPSAEIIGKFAEDAVNSLLEIVESGDLERIGQELATKVEIWMGHISTFVLRVQNSGLATALEGLSQAGGIPPIVASSLRDVGDAINTVTGIKDFLEVYNTLLAGGGIKVYDDQGNVTRDIPNVAALDPAEFIPSDTALTGPLVALGDWWKEYGPIVTAGLQTLGEVISAELTSAIETIGPFVEEFLAAFDDIGGVEILTFILLAFVGVVQAIIALGIGLITGVLRMATSFMEGLKMIWTGIVTIWDGIKLLFSGGGWSGILTGLGEVAAGVMTALTGGLVGFFTGAAEGVLSFFAGIITNLGSEVPAWVQQGIDLAAGMWEGFKEMIATAVSEIPGKIQEILDAIAEKIDDFFTIGENIIGGLWDGMKSAWGAFWDWVVRKIESIPEAWRVFLNMESPSKVMIDIGSNIMKGLSIGIAGEDPVERIPRSFNLKKLNTSLASRMEAATGGGGRAQTGASGLAAIVTQASGLATTQAASVAASVSGSATAEVGAMMAATTASSTHAQLASEAQTRGALSTKLDEVIFALQSQGNAHQTATAISEAMQTADFG